MINDKYELSEISRSILGMNKIKYQLLDELFVDNVDAFHINCDSIIDAYRKYYDSTPELNDDAVAYSAASSLLNICAHYRNYFTKHNMRTKIFIYSSTKYNEINSSLDIVSIICKYLPEIYFINIDRICDIQLAIMYFCKKYKSNIIFTRNKKDILLVNKHRSVLRANKSKSILYTKDNLYENIIGKNVNQSVSYKLFPIFASICGILTADKVHGYGPNKTFKLLENALQNGNIMNYRYNDIESFLGDIKKFNRNDSKIISKNFRYLNIYGRYLNELTKGKMSKLDDFIVDKFSNNDLRKLNEKYFTGLDSLMLNELLNLPSSKDKIQW